MPNFLVTYDVERTNPDPHSKILEFSHNFGWYKFATDIHSKFALLPNTTLFGHFSDLVTAQERFYALISYVRSQNHGLLNLEKHIICHAEPYVFASNKQLN